MLSFSIRFIAIFLSLLCFSALAQPVLSTGQYVTEGGWGNLTLKQTGKKLHFSIETIGGNGHTCSLEGDISQQQATLEGGEAGKPCVIRFDKKGSGINVSSLDPLICSGFCGLRAGFEGLYLKEIPACVSKERAKTRQKFAQLYGKKAYAQAAAPLTALLQNCALTLDWIEEGQIRNDLAVTQYHLGQLSDCQKTLAPLQASVGKTGEKLPATEQALQAILPPTDFEIYLPVAKATWHNLTLCTPVK
jgi:hypothetical protein